jgi:hypothetical protein
MLTTPLDLIPAHMRHLQRPASIIPCAAIGRKQDHLAWQDPKAVGVALFAAIKQHLFAHTDAEKGLGSAGGKYCIPQARTAQTCHAIMHRALSRKNDPICLINLLGRINDLNIGLRRNRAKRPKHAAQIS